MDVQYIWLKAPVFQEIRKKKFSKVTFRDNHWHNIIGIHYIGEDLSNSIDNVHPLDGSKYNL